MIYCYRNEGTKKEVDALVWQLILKNKKEILSFGIELVVVFLIALFLTNVVIVNARIPSSSMEPTIMTGDRLIGDRIFYKGDLHRYDVVIFRYPDDETQLFIKRIIGLPGDVVEAKNGDIYINGTLDQRAQKMAAERLNSDFGPYTVPSDHYFMMGDNRNHSLDSRFWNDPFVSSDEIIGRAIFIYYPLSEMGKIK